MAKILWLQNVFYLVNVNEQYGSYGSSLFPLTPFTLTNKANIGFSKHKRKKKYKVCP